eukprot:2917051-Amphidinium_carterae.2
MRASGTKSGNACTTCGGMWRWDRRLVAKQLVSRETPPEDMLPPERDIKLYARQASLVPSDLKVDGFTSFLLKPKLKVHQAPEAFQWLRYGYEYAGSWIVSSPRGLPAVEYEFHQGCVAKETQYAP